jgi:hypothetical protein
LSFPINRRDDRELAADYDGVVVTCDIDRTYLATRFSSLKGVARIPFEFSVDKKDIQGMAALLKELRRGPDEVSRHTPLYFVSASPHQLRPVIERKMLLDGLEHDGTTFKNWVKVMLSGRPARLKEQIGYKLTALLLARKAFPKGARDLLIGDDLESDPVAFALYADILAGRLSGDEISTVLPRLGVATDDATYIRQLAERATGAAAVKRVFIRLERRSAAELKDLAPWVVGCRGAFQMACASLAEGLISSAGAVRVAANLHASGVPQSELSDHLGDVVHRGILPASEAAALVETLANQGLVFAKPEVSADPSWPVPSPLFAGERWVPDARLG